MKVLTPPPASPPAPLPPLAPITPLPPISLPSLPALLPSLPFEVRLCHDLASALLSRDERAIEMTWAALSGAMQARASVSAPTPPAPPPAPQPSQYAPAPTVQTWRSSRDAGARHRMTEKITQLIRERKTDPTPEWLQKLPSMAYRFEHMLYMAAESFAEYTDESTLEIRLRALLNERKKQQPQPIVKRPRIRLIEERFDKTPAWCNACAKEHPFDDFVRAGPGIRFMCVHDQTSPKAMKQAAYYNALMHHPSVKERQWSWKDIGLLILEAFERNLNPNSCRVRTLSDGKVAWV